MGRYHPKQVALGLAVAGTGIFAAAMAGASLIAVVIAIFAGAGAALLIGGAGSKDEQSAPGKASAPSPAPIEAAPIIDAIADPLLLIRARRVVLANAAAKAVLGDHIEDADVRLAIRHPAAAERLAALDTTGEDAEVDLLGLGGDERRWEMSIARLPDGSRLVRLIDKSEARAAEQMRTDFIANASHELRTPLATILGFLETLQEDEGADPATKRRFLTIMTGEATRMRQIVNDLISLSRIEAERYILPRTPIDLLPVIAEVQDTLENLIRECKARIVLEQETTDAVVAGDRAQLHQLFSNLIANALKYGREGSPVRVRIEEADADMLRISIIDEGEGIGPEHLPRLTERFYRVDAGRSRAVGGTGLGLAIVKHIAGRHRGRIDIRSKVGEGTEVSVYLPRLDGPLS